MSKKKNLFDLDYIIQTAKHRKFAPLSILKFLVNIPSINKINKLCKESNKENGIELIDLILSEFELKYEISDIDIKKIPTIGKTIIISNHPYGSIDSLLLIKAISSIRSDIKVLSNPVLSKIESLNKYFFDNDPFYKKTSKKDGLKTLKEVYSHISNDGCLCIFPSTDGGIFEEASGEVIDNKWRESVIKFVKRLESPIINIHISGNNGKAYKILNLINPKLKKLKVPNDFINKVSGVLNISVSSIISVKEQKEFDDIAQFTRYLRARTFISGSKIDVKSFFNSTQKSKKIQDISEPRDKTVLIQEIEFLKKDFLLFNYENFSAICAPSSNMPNLMHEIGRMREITFRAVGEGTNKSIDIDEYDLHYYQLCVWDNTEQKILGGYRIGLGNEIFESYGFDGFYLNSLYKIDPAFEPYIRESVETGRSFITEEYQRKPLSLFILWKGVIHFFYKTLGYRYMIGPVSISDDFSHLSKSLIVEFVKRHYFDKELSALVKPRHGFKPSLKGIDKDALIEPSSDLKKLDKLVEDLELGKRRLPVLWKKYIGINAKIISFNIDAKFNNTLDGFIFIDTHIIPTDQLIKHFSGMDKSFLKRFNQ